VTMGYDGRGNLTSSGTSAYTYNADNLLLTGPSGTTLAYDPAGRLRQTVGAGVTTRFQYDGINLTAEYNASNTLQRRYVHGPGSDEPIVWYEGIAVSIATCRHLMRDEDGNVTSVTDSSGAIPAINRVVRELTDSRHAQPDRQRERHRTDRERGARMVRQSQDSVALNDARQVHPERFRRELPWADAR
jgi:hypothetical protein